MKKVILLGDSIRFGYAKYVQTALVESADVMHPDSSCMFAEYTLRFVHEWKKNHQWPDDVDLVHWNVGLWDALELFGDAPLTSLAYYEEVIGRLNKRLRMLFPKAKMVFATSTAVQEELYWDEFRRHNATIEAYNAAALRALAGTDTVINDLYALTSGCPASCYSDVTHFNCRDGVQLVGNQVVAAICQQLDIEAVPVDMDRFVREEYPDQVIGY